MSELSMPSQDQESFHLLQISESQSDSLPDLDLVTVNTQHKKKKVRLKRYGCCYLYCTLKVPREKVGRQIPIFKE